MDRKILKCDNNSKEQEKLLSDVDNRNERKHSKPHTQNKLEAPIFKLNADCLYKIFDYLSLQDVHSIGQTCKPMQQIAGEYFQVNHVTEVYANSKDIIIYPGNYMPLDGFNEYIQNLRFSTWFPSRTLKKITWYAAQNYNREFKRMGFYVADLTGAEIVNLSDKFERVESVTIERCIVNRKFYQQFPRLCKNLRRLYVEDFDCRRDVLRRTGNEWLLWTYPKLEHLHWTQTKNWRPFNELKQFFERNPQSRSFTTDIDSLWTSRHVFSDSEISLDDLTIEIGREDEEPRRIEYIYSFLKELYEKGVYKRLHIRMKFFSQRFINEMPPLNALKSLCLDHNVVGYMADVTLPKWFNLTELKLSSYSNLLGVDVLAQQLVNLRRIHFHYISFSDLMQFVRYSVYLSKVKVKNLDDIYHNYDQNNSLDVAALNKEREKLIGAKKMIIYIDEEIYLQTKWASNGIDYSLIEIRRESSHEWGHQFMPLY